MAAAVAIAKRSRIVVPTRGEKQRRNSEKFAKKRDLPPPIPTTATTAIAAVVVGTPGGGQEEAEGPEEAAAAMAATGDSNRVAVAGVGKTYPRPSLHRPTRWTLRLGPGPC